MEYGLCGFMSFIAHFPVYTTLELKLVEMTLCILGGLRVKRISLRIKTINLRVKRMSLRCLNLTMDSNCPNPLPGSSKGVLRLKGSWLGYSRVWSSLRRA